jgi:hypothetical protein
MKIFFSRRGIKKKSAGRKKSPKGLQVWFLRIGNGG